MKSKNIKNLFGGLVFFLLLLIMPLSFAQASSTLIAAETVSNVVVGAHDDQAIASTTSTANVGEDKASTTLVVTALPTSGTNVIIGGCTVNFQVAASSTAGLNCTTNSVNIDIGAGTSATTTAHLAATLAMVVAILPARPDSFKR